MIGDNPAADIRGANAAQGPWRSILVRTGPWVESRAPNLGGGGGGGVP